MKSPFRVALLLCLALPGTVRAGEGVELAGDALQLLLPATAAGLTLARGDRAGTLQLAESLGLTLALTYGLKYAVNAERPNGGGQSFPSGHASVSFSSAEFLRKRYGRGWGLPAYALASFVAYSRVEAGKHYTRDVVAGAALGVACSYFFTDSFVKTELQAGAGGYYGVRLSAAW